MDRWTSQTDSWNGGMTPAVRALLILTLAAYILQLLLDHVTSGLFTNLYAGLSLEGIQHGRIWQLITYMFLHANLLHLLMNMLGLFFMGPETERSMGRSHFLVLYFLSGLLGGLGWLLISSNSWIPCVGASGAIFGVIGAFAAIHPNRMITVLVMFILPVTMRAWMLAAGLGLIEFLYLLNSSTAGIAYAAHLAGGISGFIYGWTVSHDSSEISGRFKGAWRRSSFKVLEGGLAAKPSQAEVDAILDKISREGIQSISRHERSILEKASQKESV